MNINTFCDIWNNKVHNNDALNIIRDSQSQLSEENVANHYTFTMPDQVLKIRWVISLSQVLHYSPLPDCLAVTKKPFTVTIFSLFENTVIDTLVTLSIVELEKVTNFCSVERIL